MRSGTGDGVYENLITNLPQDEFDMNSLKELYYLRWGLETAFRELKHAIGAVDFHAKSLEYVTHEVWARLLLYNFCSVITSIAVSKKRKKQSISTRSTTLWQLKTHMISCGKKKEPRLWISSA